MANFNGVSAARAAYEAAIAARTEAGKKDLTDAGNRVALTAARAAVDAAFAAYIAARRDDAAFAAQEKAAYASQVRAAHSAHHAAITAGRV
jgi:hypothetical protein